MQNQKQISLPQNLLSAIGEEPIEFSLYTRRKYTIATIIQRVTFALTWTIFSLFLFYKIILTDLLTETSNDFKFFSIFHNVSSFVIFLFFVIGIILLVRAMLGIFSKGGFFICVPSRLIHYKNNKIKYYSWDLFSEKISVYPKLGEIIFRLRTGKIHSNFEGRNYFVSDKIEITSIENPKHIEKIIRKHIKKNTP